MPNRSLCIIMWSDKWPNTLTNVRKLANVVGNWLLFWTLYYNIILCKVQHAHVRVQVVQVIKRFTQFPKLEGLEGWVRLESLGRSFGWFKRWWSSLSWPTHWFDALKMHHARSRHKIDERLLTRNSIAMSPESLQHEGGLNDCIFRHLSRLSYGWTVRQEPRGESQWTYHDPGSWLWPSVTRTALVHALPSFFNACDTTSIILPSMRSLMHAYDMTSIVTIIL